MDAVDIILIVIGCAFGLMSLAFGLVTLVIRSFANPEAAGNESSTAPAHAEAEGLAGYSVGSAI